MTVTSLGLVSLASPSHPSAFLGLHQQVVVASPQRPTYGNSLTLTLEAAEFPAAGALVAYLLGCRLLLTWPAETVALGSWAALW
jgi:hypothetical protein